VSGMSTPTLLSAQPSPLPFSPLLPLLPTDTSAGPAAADASQSDDNNSSLNNSLTSI
jgi:hypothetical protein